MNSSGCCSSAATPAALYIAPGVRAVCRRLDALRRVAVGLRAECDRDDFVYRLFLRRFANTPRVDLRRHAAAFAEASREPAQ